MTNISNVTKTVSVPQNCDMKGMHESHENQTKKAEIANPQQTAQVEVAKNQIIGNKLDVRL